VPTLGSYVVKENDNKFSYIPGSMCNTSGIVYLVKHVGSGMDDAVYNRFTSACAVCLGLPGKTFCWSWKVLEFLKEESWNNEFHKAT